MLSVRFTAEQVRLIEKRAEKCGMTTRAWLRNIAVQAATRQSNRGYTYIREPNGAST
jgi:hypothetical protein